MKYIVLILSFLRLVNSVSLYLPFNQRDSDIFKITKYQSKGSLFDSGSGVEYHHTFYETNEGQAITNVIYKGYLLFSDTKRKKPPFRRLVNYCKMDSRTLITIYCVKTKMELEGVFYVANMKVYDLMASSKVFRENREDIMKKAESITLKSIYFIMDPRLVNYDEIDGIAEPQMLRANRDVTEKEIEEDVRRIYRTIILKDKDIDAPSTSGTQKQKSH